MSWKLDEEALRAVEKERDKWIQKRTDSEDDFAILSDQEIVIAKMYTICENTDYLTQCLESSVDNIVEVSSAVDIPGFNDMFDFEDLRLNGGMVGRLKDSNTEYMDMLKQKGQKIDELKAIVASEVKNANNQISRIAAEIQKIRDRPIWVED